MTEPIRWLNPPPMPLGMRLMLRCRDAMEADRPMRMTRLEHLEFWGFYLATANESQFTGYPVTLRPLVAADV